MAIVLTNHSATHPHACQTVPGGSRTPIRGGTFYANTKIKLRVTIFAFHRLYLNFQTLSSFRPFSIPVYFSIGLSSLFAAFPDFSIAMPPRSMWAACSNYGLKLIDWVTDLFIYLSIYLFMLFIDRLTDSFVPKCHNVLIFVWTGPPFSPTKNAGAPVWLLLLTSVRFRTDWKTIFSVLKTG